MNIFQTVIATDYGNVPVVGDAALILDRAPKRKDGQPDRRYTYGKMADFIILSTIERKRAEFMVS